MPSRPATYDTLDDAALAVGFGFVLVGTGVLGVFETVVGSAHITQHVPGIGVVVVHTSVAPHLRASIIAGGLLVLFAWSLVRASHAVIRSRS